MGELALNVGNLPAHLQNAELTDEFSGGISSGGLGAPMLSIRGKEFRFRSDGNETSTRSRTLQVVLLKSRPHMSRRFYSGQYTGGETSAPLCASQDGNRPDDNVLEKQADLCARCPRNQWGSKITASGKKAKECADYKRMLVLPVFDGVITDQPVLFDVPITSLRKLKGDRSDNMYLQEYTGALARHKIPPYGVLTTLEFTDAEFPQVSFRLERALEESEFNRMVAMRADEDITDLLGMDEAPGPIREVEAKPEEILGAAPPPPAEPEPAPKPEAAPAPEGKEEPKAEPPSDDAVMADVKKLLGGL